MAERNSEVSEQISKLLGQNRGRPTRKFANSARNLIGCYDYTICFN